MCVEKVEHGNGPLYFFLRAKEIEVIGIFVESCELNDFVILSVSEGIYLVFT